MSYGYFRLEIRQKPISTSAHNSSANSVAAPEKSRRIAVPILSVAGKNGRILHPSIKFKTSQVAGRKMLLVTTKEFVMSVALLNSQKQLFGAFPMSIDRLATMRNVLAEDIAYFENIDLLNLDRGQLGETIKAAATAKAMQSATTEEGFLAIRQHAFLQGGALTWPEALVIMLNSVPDIGSVRLDLKPKQFLLAA
jgi:hypothetical protein